MKAVGLLRKRRLDSNIPIVGPIGRPNNIRGRKDRREKPSRDIGQGRIVKNCAKKTFSYVAIVR